MEEENPDPVDAFDADAPPDDSGLLDQSEIDQLLAMAEEEEAPNLLRVGGERGTADEMRRVEAYDFRNPAFLSEIELRRLRILHEDFIRYLSARLSLMLRMDCAMKMSKLETQTFERFSEALPNPTHLCLFKVEPLSGVGVLDINPRLAITFVDRLLGGKGHSVQAERYLTEIEITLLEDLLKVVIEEWCDQWKDEQEVHPSIVGHENNGRFLQTSPRDAVVLALAIECSFGDCSEALQIGVPYYMIEPLVKSVQTRREKETDSSAPSQPAEWRPIYEHVTVPVQADWQLTDVTLREVSAWRVGDVLELPVSVIDHTLIQLNGLPKFEGTVGLEGDHTAVKIHRKLKSGDPDNADLRSHG